MNHLTLSKTSRNNQSEPKNLNTELDEPDQSIPEQSLGQTQKDRRT